MHFKMLGYTRFFAIVSKERDTLFDSLDDNTLPKGGLRSIPEKQSPSFKT